MNTERTQVEQWITKMTTLKQAIERSLGYSITDSQYHRYLEIAKQELINAGHKMPMPSPSRIARIIQAEIKTISQERPLNTEMSITYRLDLETGIDPYRADTGGLTVPAMWIAVHDDKVVVGVSQEYPGQTGENPEDLKLVHVQYRADDNSTPDPEEFESYIRSDAAQSLVRRIAAGHRIDWTARPGDGFLTSYLDKDAEAARAELEAAIADLPRDKRATWLCEDWFGLEDFDEIDADTVDDYITDPVGDQADVIALADDPKAHLMSRAFESIAHELDGDDADEIQIQVRGFGVFVDRNSAGEITRVVSITTPAGHSYENPMPAPKTTSGTAPDTSLHLGEQRKNWLREHGGIQPTIHRLIDEAIVNSG